MVAANPVNPALLNSLTLKWGRTKADLDDQQNRYNINYNNALQKMQKSYGDTSLRASEGLADRGMVQSGPALKQGLKLRDELTQQQGLASQALQTNLATIARKRLETDQEYNTQKLLASLGLSTG